MPIVETVSNHLAVALQRLQPKPRSSTREQFNEAAYLAAHQDVRDAVEGGRIRSGWHHYRSVGRREGRALCPQPVTRRDKVISGLDVRRLSGVEIGPLTAPIVAKSDGDVLYVDHVGTDDLKAKYACDEKVNPADIVPVDRVWGAQTLQDCLGPGTLVDYVIASHVIEHVPDMVTWLEEVRAILKPGGSLRLVIPDRRFTFDILRAESTLADALDAHIRKARVPLVRSILDHFLHYVDVDASLAWRGLVTKQNVRPDRPPGFALEVAKTFHASGGYQDVHCWVFTPPSFAHLATQLAQLDLLRFGCERIYPTQAGHNEFVAILTVGDETSDRVRTWQAAARELDAPSS